MVISLYACCQGFYIMLIKGYVVAMVYILEFFKLYIVYCSAGIKFYLYQSTMSSNYVKGGLSNLVGLYILGWQCVLWKKWVNTLRLRSLATKSVSVQAISSVNKLKMVYKMWWVYMS